jgi:hypothetical protein
MNELLLDGERERLARLASSGAPSEWAAARPAAKIFRCVDAGVLPSQNAIEWFRRFRKGET